MFHHQDNVGNGKVVRDCFCRFCIGLENQRRLHVRFSLLVACENQNWKKSPLRRPFSILFKNIFLQRVLSHLAGTLLSNYT